MRVYDKENEDELLEKVTQESCKRAFKLMSELYPDNIDNIIEEDYDANDADIFFQLATMGKIVFG
jgi:hypothetical protein